MKNNWKTLSAICICLFLLAACKKSPNTSTAGPNAKQQNEDINNTRSESDNSNSDVNNAIYNASTFGKTGSNQSLDICGGTVDTTGNANHSITITYDGSTPCGGRIRSGKIIIALIAGNHWGDQGAILKITYQDYKVTFTSNNHYITFNGSKYLKDVNGINWLAFVTGGSPGQISERSDSLSLTFDDGSVRTWQIARKTTYNVVTSPYSVNATIDGDTTIDGHTVDTWGVTRFGTNFVVQVSQPWVSGSVCGWWAPTSGQYTCVTDNFSITATLGVNSSGTQINTGCAYGFKLNWTVNANNSSGEAILPYW